MPLIFPACWGTDAEGTSDTSLSINFGMSWKKHYFSSFRKGFIKFWTLLVYTWLPSQNTMMLKTDLNENTTEIPPRVKMHRWGQQEIKLTHSFCLLILQLSCSLQLPTTSALVLLLCLNPTIFLLHWFYFTAISQVWNTWKFFHPHALIYEIGAQRVIVSCTFSLQK